MQERFPRNKLKEIYKIKKPAVKLVSFQLTYYNYFPLVNYPLLISCLKNKQKRRIEALAH